MDAQLISRQVGAMLDALAPDFPNFGYHEPAMLAPRTREPHTPVPVIAADGNPFLCICALGGGTTHMICRCCGTSLVYFKNTTMGKDVPVHLSSC